MFANSAEARIVLQADFDPPIVEALVGALVPALVLAPINEPPALGRTKLGGVPDLAAGAKWPRPPAPDDVEALASRGSEDARQATRDHLALGLPYAFFAQIDLAEAAGLGDVAAILPSDGRLLFFYDLVIGPWETGSRPARVLWDRAPREDLEPLETPPDLAEAAGRYRQEMAEIRLKYGHSAEHANEGTNYGAPARAMKLTPIVRLPSPFSLKMAALPDLHAVYRGESTDSEWVAVRDTYNEVLDTYPEDAWQRQQFLGTPLSEQDDPRFDAVVVSLFGKQHLPSNEWKTQKATIEAEARDWLLLLQIDLGDWMQADLVEGTVYFVIREADLADRAFDKTMAVYQQT